MGLLQQAVKTYDVMDNIGLVGKYEEGKEPLAPIAHILCNAHILITLNNKGEFVDAEKINKKIIIPVSEESSGRTSSPIAHPLCDNIGYISGCDKYKYDLYLKCLSDWVNSHYSDIKLELILKYVKSRSLLNDISHFINYDDNGNISNEKENICWKIIGLDNNNGTVYEDINLMKKYISYYLEKRCLQNSLKSDYCYVSGKNEYLANQHIKGIVPLFGNAKLISANDTSNFTYRGRFFDSNEVLAIGFETSQKAHNLIKWMVANQKVIIGKRVFICWNPNGKEIPTINSSLFNYKKNIKILPSDYKKELKSVLYGFKNNLNDDEKVIIVSFDAATSGRLSISYYNEMQQVDFLNRLLLWDETCCWLEYNKGVFSPRLDDIINCSYGYQRGNDDTSRFETDEKIISQYMQRLIICRVNNNKIPKDIVRKIVNNCCNLQVYNKINRKKILFTACAVIKKYLFDYKREECQMALEQDKKDRSYQYGRLLAVLEKIEKDTYSEDEKRETNAIRMQSIFVKRPAYASKMIIEQLNNSYFPKLKRDKPGLSVKYDKIIGQIMNILSEYEDDYNKPLTETYLLGYYLQRNAFYEKNNQLEEVKENE